jgi:hypothetical protein
MMMCPRQATGSRCFLVGPQIGAMGARQIIEIEETNLGHSTAMVLAADCQASEAQGA